MPGADARLGSLKRNQTRRACSSARSLRLFFGKLFDMGKIREVGGGGWVVLRCFSPPFLRGF